MGIRIEISYKKKTKHGILGKQYLLAPEDYFDLEILENSEKLDIDSLPLYDHATEYLYKLDNHFEKKDIEETKIVLKHQMKTKIISEKFWNEGSNCLIECLDLYPDYCSNIVILVSRINNETEEVFRIIKTTGMETFDPVSHSISDIETEESICSYSFERSTLR